MLTNQKLNDMEREELERDKQTVPKRRILKHANFAENKAARQLNYLDGFYLMQLCCVDDPLDLCSIDISNKSLKKVRNQNNARQNGQHFN